MTTYLSDTLNIGKESAYRRMKGEINFTFEEIILLSQKIGFSIDSIVGVRQKQNALFNIHMLQDKDPFDIYTDKMAEYSRLFRNGSEKQGAKVRMALNTLPYYLHIDYEGLSRFRIYKWLYQNQLIKSKTNKFADFTLNPKMLDTHKTFHQDINKIQNFTVIMDDDVFWSMAKDIEYFYKMGLLTKDDLLTLKSEMYELLVSVEQMATTGTTKYGSKIDLYVSSVSLEASYLHFEYANAQFSQVRIFSISAMDSSDKRLCTIQKDWIESLKKYSVLVSESGEMQRFEYMNKQREYINTILTV